MTVLAADDGSMNKHGHESGFTLIEVLVASAIIMASIGVLMQLFASGLDRTHRAGEVAHLLTAERSILHELEMVNPAMQQTGEGVVEGVQYHWQAKEKIGMKPVYDADGISGVSSSRQIALFEVQVSMLSERGKSILFTFDLIGWKDGL